MRIIKSIALIIAIFACCLSMQAEDKLPSWLTMKDLTDPKSPSYVPYPFPKTRHEIIEDLKYQAARKYFGENRWKSLPPGTIELLPELFNVNSNVIIDEVVKIKNRIPGFPSGYSYLITIFDTKRHLVSRVAMRACGLIIGGQRPNKRNPGKKLKKDSNVLKELSKYHKAASKEENVKKIERVAHDISYAPPQNPIYEVTMADGSIYYVDYHDHVYKKTMEKTVKGEKISFLRSETKKLRANREKLRRGDVVFIDAINNKTIYLQRLTDKELQ